MRKVSTAEAVEEIIGKQPVPVMLKAVDALDEGCCEVIARTPVAALGFRDHDGVPHTTFVGGLPGFTRVESPTSVSFEVPAGSPRPASGGGASMIFIMPGIGETLRLNGVAAAVSGDRVTIDLHETYFHCARCMLRSKLWKDAPAQRAHHGIDVPSSRDDEVAGPLSRPAVADFLSSASFLAVSSWDGSDRGDTSPKGDPAGFVRVIDGHTLAIPDRRGNRRADTLHNLTACDELSFAALVAGRDDVLHISGTAYMTDDQTLRSTMAIGEVVPNLAVVVRVARADIKPNEAVKRSGMWDPSTHLDRSQIPDLNKLGAQHMARNKERGAMASMTRVVGRGLAASAKLTTRAVDAVYRNELKKEGY